MTTRNERPSLDHAAALAPVAARTAQQSVHSRAKPATVANEFHGSVETVAAGADVGASGGNRPRAAADAEPAQARDEYLRVAAGIRMVGADEPAVGRPVCGGPPGVTVCACIHTVMIPRRKAG